MAYNEKVLKKDFEGNPTPQVYIPSQDNYFVLTGAELGGGRYGQDNLMWGMTVGGVYVPVAVGNDGEVLTKLTGRTNAVNIVDREIITSSFTRSISTPSNAKGVIISSRIMGMTGDYSGENDGLQIGIFDKGALALGNAIGALTKRIKKIESQSFYWYPGATAGDGILGDPTGDRDVKVIGLPLSSLHLIINLNATHLEEGEGVDLWVRAKWFIH